MIPGSLYQPIYIHIMAILTILYILNHQNENYLTVLRGHNNYRTSLFFCIIYTLFYGLRPVATGWFGDTVNYLRTYELFQYRLIEYDPETSDWLFSLLMSKCATIMDASYFFLIIEVGYIGCTLWACKRLMQNNIWAALIFAMSIFSFYSYSINGIRNGLGCAVVLVALSYILGSKKEKIIAAILCLCAYNIHHSTALPILMMVISAFYVKNLKLTTAWWFVSILLSLTVSSQIENFFALLGFDDRLNTYITNTDYDDEFSSVGFRWDFLLYSVMPIILGWYIVFKKKVADQTYLMLLNTYILSNSFWIMIIRASFSNRFAYLSWFMYGILLAYPLLKLPIWRDQGKKVNWIMAANTGFTYLTWILGIHK